MNRAVRLADGSLHVTDKRIMMSMGSIWITEERFTIAHFTSFLAAATSPRVI